MIVIGSIVESAPQERSRGALSHEGRHTRMSWRRAVWPENAIVQRTSRPGPTTDFPQVRGFSEQAATGYPVALPPPELDNGPHLGYAIQWFIFATIGLVGWGTLLLRGGSGSGGPKQREESHEEIKDRALADHSAGPPRLR